MYNVIMIDDPKHYKAGFFKSINWNVFYHNKFLFFILCCIIAAIFGAVFYVIISL